MLSRCPSPLSLPRFPLSLRPDFSCLPSRFLYSASLFVSFRPSLIRSHSCSSGASLVLSLSGFSASLPVPFVPFFSASGYLASVSSFPLSSRFRLTVASPVLRLRLRFLSFPRSFQPGFPCFLSRFPYSAFCLFPFVLPSFAPTAVPLVLTLCFRFRSCPGPFRFLSSASSVPTTQPSALSFPFIPASPRSGSFRCRFIRFPFACFHAPFPLWYSASCSSFLLLLRFASQVAFRKLRLFLSALAASP